MTAHCEKAPEYALEADDLKKVYHTPKNAPNTALKDLSLKVRRGSMFALLGPNGAGKSTFINILAGLTLKTGGQARIWGHDITQERRLASASIGVVPQELNMDVFFTPFETLEIQAGYYGLPKAERRSMEILEAVGLADKRDAYVRHLSGGMKRRLLVAKAMVHNPPVLVLDEPTAGVDVELRHQLWSYVKRLNEQGTTVILTTHYLEEAQELCDEIAIIHHGELVAWESKTDLLKKLDHKHLYIKPESPLTRLPEGLEELDAELQDDGLLRISYNPARTSVGEVLQKVHKTRIGIADLNTQEPDLEDIFVALTYNKDKAS